MSRARRAAPKGAPPAPPRHAASHGPRLPVGRVVGLVTVAVLAFGGSAAALAAVRLNGNVERVDDISHLVAAPSASPTEPPPPGDSWAGQPVRFVAMGSDDRSGVNAEIGGADDGMRSDTTMIVQVSADRTRVEVVSIPRDSWVRIPACHLDRDPDGPMSRPRTDKFNSAFAIGADTGDVGLAAACTLSTIAENTGLMMSDFLLVDFAGFQGMVDAIGGVRVCVPRAIRDTKGNTELDLAAGWHDLAGQQALDYVRARYVTGSDNSDTQRIPRQQKFVGAMTRKVLSAEVLTSPRSIYGFLDAATRSLTASDQLGAPDNLVGLALSLRELQPSAVTFATVPNGSADGHLVWTPDADLVWQRLELDLPLVDPPAPEVPDPGAGTGTGEPADPAAGAPADGTGAPADGAGTPADGATGAAPPVPAPEVTTQSGVDPDDPMCG
ncbi:LCP family protein [Cellulomonas sp. 179-A 4D5 NHS]|uniref:LCP family protein n=1 Tax=Cellulomonas sp. 179-A 4D5 NHS TaxID=3142378 RepID=UPI0039A2184B